ncbi:hypothetical protein JTE90_027499 [Oedothorax gibbosus]|uniref:Uncharacterized protein n=1 Tax=Oedothorax gibbosus TaxID=931172 RepID=A0AAV6TDH4_9ARAC|nr:hypothetical protein JTE90_027499 [Oedothorax gibbosus]
MKVQAGGGRAALSAYPVPSRAGRHRRNPPRSTGKWRSLSAHVGTRKDGETMPGARTRPRGNSGGRSRSWF